MADTTGAAVVSSSRLTGEAKLGSAELITEEIVSGERRTVIRGVPDADAGTVLLRGGSRSVLDEVHRSVEDALGALDALFETGNVVPGGGAVELSLRQHVDGAATHTSDRRQMAIRGFADAFERIPLVLAQNAGQSPVDALTRLRERHARGDHAAGVDAFTGGVIDAREAGVLDPLGVKRRAIDAATDVVTSILTIDGAVAVSGQFDD
ncbi:MAG: chaperonin GroEL (HSP60 family) [uncultured archaeon A07HB70]|nr:MAG: chaperonin GroEL (HSP60 family) [uncultured archaeon A07HB70]